MTGRSMFPISFLSSQLGMTGLLVGLGFLGRTEMAADVGIVQGAALALFFGFSGNARSVILKSNDVGVVRSILFARLILMFPLCLGVYYLGSILGNVAWGLSAILILRKCVEWVNELHLSEAERDNDLGVARAYFLIQTFLLGAVGLCIIFDSSLLLSAMFVWAIGPLALTLPFIGRTIKANQSSLSWMMLLPHLGSTAVTGIGVYVFRITILLLVEKAVAGSLFTAFAIGGLLGSLFVFGFGPSLVLNEQRTGDRRLPGLFRLILSLVGAFGVAITLAAHFAASPDSVVFGRDVLFWQALGFSLIGSVVMVFAHRQRLRDLQHGSKDDVFAPDVLVNIIIVIFIPTVFYVFGVHGMTWLSLFNAVVALVFYWMTDPGRASRIVGERWRNIFRVVISVMIVFPVFINLETGLFRSSEFLYDSGGILSRLPIPLSVGWCYVGIAIIGNYRRANLGLAVVFITFVLMVLSTVSTNFDTQSAERGKLFLLLQFVLPMFALVLGMMFESDKKKDRGFEKVFLLVVATIVPLELLCNWLQGRLYLTPYLYLFSIYQHMQYVPVVMMAGYVLGAFTLWDRGAWCFLLIAITPLFAIYATASASFAALGFGLLGLIVFVVFRLSRWATRKGRKLEWLALFLFVASFLSYNYYVSIAADLDSGIWKSQLAKEMAMRSGASPDGSDSGSGGSEVHLNDAVVDTSNEQGGMFFEKVSEKGLANLNERFVIWAYYGEKIIQDPLSFIFGQVRPPDRDFVPSAHNYYLDFTYNFGLISLIPILALIGHTLRILVKDRRSVIASQATVGLALVVLVLLFCDNFVKVSMRMPYSGIVIFFLWGLLLSRLTDLDEKAGKLIDDTGRGAS